MSDSHLNTTPGTGGDGARIATNRRTNAEGLFVEQTEVVLYDKNGNVLDLTGGALKTSRQGTKTNATLALTDTARHTLLDTGANGDLTVTKRGFLVYFPDAMTAPITLLIDSQGTFAGHAFYSVTLDPASTILYAIDAQYGAVHFGGGKAGVTAEAASFVMLDMPCAQLVVEAQATAAPGGKTIGLDYIRI